MGSSDAAKDARGGCLRPAAAGLPHCHLQGALTLVLTLILAVLWVFPFEVDRSGEGDGARIRGSAPGHAEQRVTSYLGEDVPGCQLYDAPSFWGMGVTVSTDKVTLPASHIPMSHTYQFPYERWLRPIRCKRLRALEIGLGCGMPYRGINGGYAATTEGHSVPLWLAFLPHANLTVMEYDAKCAAAFMANDPLKLGPELARRVRMFGGDQSKAQDLLATMAQEGVGPQDVIIDDGGHSMKQQLTTLRTLLPWVRPGGILVMEDLQSTYSWLDPAWHDSGNVAPTMDCACSVELGGKGASSARPKAITHSHPAHCARRRADIKEMISGLTWPEYAQKLDKEVYPDLVELLPLVKSIECFSELCVFQRWGEGEWPAPIPEPAAVMF